MRSFSRAISIAKLAKDLVETSQTTNQDGQTVGNATELSSTLTQMRYNASATLTGIVKLDECVDVDQKYVLVTLAGSHQCPKQQRQPTPK